MRRVVGLAVANAALIALLLWCSPAAQARDVVVTSFDGTPVAAHFYPAVGLAPGQRAPTVLIGPGWATVGDTSPDANLGDRIGTANLRNDGYNVLTWDPRGFGASGGVSTFDSPAFEGRDVSALIDYVAAQPEAHLDAAGDPRVGMSGSSYGGGIQLVAAAIDQRLDAIVPDLAWNSLTNGAGKDGAFRAGWWLSLCAYGEVFGLTAFPPGPSVQLGSVDPAFTTMCLEGNCSESCRRPARSGSRPAGRARSSARSVRRRCSCRGRPTRSWGSIRRSRTTPRCAPTTSP